MFLKAAIQFEHILPNPNDGTAERLCENSNSADVHRISFYYPEMIASLAYLIALEVPALRMPFYPACLY